MKLQWFSSCFLSVHEIMDAMYYVKSFLLHRNRSFISNKRISIFPISEKNKTNIIYIFGELPHNYTVTRYCINERQIMDLTVWIYMTHFRVWRSNSPYIQTVRHIFDTKPLISMHWKGTCWKNDLSLCMCGCLQVIILSSKDLW